MNTPHTPGPWTVDHLGQIIGPRDGCSHAIIAHMPAWFSLPKAGAHATQDHILANAQLIASAPLLLAALQAILTEANRGGFTTVIAQASSAIAKATLDKLKP